MHVHLPKPLHGWRAFVGEVGIIVIGVLIALGAEQVVETLHWRSEVAEFRSAVRQEVALDLGTYRYRMNENGCVKARLDELDKWLDGWRGNRPMALVGPISAPASLSLQTSVWAGRDANVMAHVPDEERLELGKLYDRFANNEVHRLDERETWLRLGEFDGATALDQNDLMRLRGLITRARYRDSHMTDNAVRYFVIAEEMGIAPHIQDDPPAVDPAFCKSVFSPALRPGG
jgi:hypothetical protein